VIFGGGKSKNNSEQSLNYSETGDFGGGKGKFTTIS
jgi:hypothetical protein